MPSTTISVWRTADGTGPRTGFHGVYLGGGV
jgi:hypothetical protein